LLDSLGEFGRNFSFDVEYDYFVIDDEYDSRHHKIEVLNPAFWTEDVQERIREVLTASFPAWGVFVIFSEGAYGRRGFILYADRIEFDPSG
jgi:hypothetical protein